MATSGDLIETLADSLGWTPAKVLSYAAALRSSGWWQPTKRGRAASPATERDAATLLLAVLSEGPKDVPEFMNRYAPLRHFNAWGLLSGSMTSMVMEGFLNLPKEGATFLDAICGIVQFYRDGFAEKIVYHTYDPNLAKSYYQGPNVAVVVRGPFPTAEVNCIISDFLEEKVKAQFPDARDSGSCEIAFVPEIMGLYWHKEHPPEAEARLKEFETFKDTKARGIQFERKIGGRELTALGELLRQSEPAFGEAK